MTGFLLVIRIRKYSCQELLRAAQSCSELPGVELSNVVKGTIKKMIGFWLVVRIRNIAPRS